MQSQKITVAANEAEDDEEYDIPGEIENVVGVLKWDRICYKVCTLYVQHAQC